MKYPNFNEEKKLWARGVKYVAGLDEAGRGPLAGPVVAAAVLFKGGFLSRDRKPPGLRGLKINDSKKLSEKERENAYKVLINHPDIKWGIGIVSEKIIDKINILQATKLAMVRAISVLPCAHDREHKVTVDYLLIDGNFKINTDILQKSIIKGDQKVFSIAAASIIAKVTRDRLMQKYHKKYPQYNFSQHKGYGTKAHFAALQKFGPCKIHRKTFYPIKEG